MDEKEQEKKQEEKPKEPAKNSEEGSKPQTTTLIDDANLAAERLEKANERKTELLKQEEELEARKALGGTTEAGQTSEPKEETSKEYRERIEKELAEGKL